MITAVALIILGAITGVIAIVYYLVKSYMNGSDW